MFSRVEALLFSFKGFFFEISNDQLSVNFLRGEWQDHQHFFSNKLFVSSD